MNMPYPLTSLNFWRCYWITCRPYLLFVSGVAGAVGLAIPSSLHWSRLVAASVAFFLSYGLGQALTDVFQVDTDSISAPYRPLTQGLVGRRQVLGVSLAGLLLCTAVFIICNPWTLIPSLLGVLGLASYTSFKRRWWAGPLWNAWIVALLPLIGVLCGEVDIRTALSSRLLWPAMGSVFFGYAIFVLLGYFKDVSADRATGYQTMVVKFGWTIPVVVSLGFVLAEFLLGLMLLSRIGPVGWPAWAMWSSGLMVTLFAHWEILHTRRESCAHRAIALVVRGFLLVHLGLVDALRVDLVWPAFIFYLLFEATLAIRPERSQV